MFGGPRWRRVGSSDVEWLEQRLLAPVGEGVGGAIRHLVALGTLEAGAMHELRVAADGDRWAAALAPSSRLLVPCGDPSLLAELGPPTRRWRLAVSDVAAMRACLDGELRGGGMRIHDQRLMRLDVSMLPSSQELADPGVRPAVSADVDALAELAVVLHVDDEFGPHPGRLGLAGYRERLASSVDQGRIQVVGPVGAPVAKLELAVVSHRWGTQLSGIVVHPLHRNAGVGTGLVAQAAREALHQRAPTLVTLHVRAANDRARAVYKRVGFVDVEDWLLVVRS